MFSITIWNKYDVLPGDCNNQEWFFVVLLWHRSKNLLSTFIFKSVTPHHLFENTNYVLNGDWNMV